LTLYLDTPENAEVAAGAGLPFTRENLSEVIELTSIMPSQERTEWQLRAIKRVEERYSWDRVTDSYENLLTRLARA
jgi:glycosyltransferase involved in cell wall biosynthesis